MAAGKRTYKFKSEAQQLLDLMVHSVYSTKEVFLRELVSNASDALDKRRFEALTDEALALPEAAGIRIWADAEARTLTVEDDGVGMARDEVIDNLGTIARSGTKEFAAALAERAEQGDSAGSGADGGDLIGQFGVGFYSVFMVADRAEVLTRRAGQDEAVLWSSSGDGKFSVQDGERAAAGTTVTLHLRPAAPDDGLDDFATNHALRTVIKRHSDFVQYPISLRTPPSADVDVDAGADAAANAYGGWEVVNSMKAIWTRSETEVTDEEYEKFYKHVAKDWQPPLSRVRFRAEGAFEYDALLFIPSQPPFDLFYREGQFGLQLYANRVLIVERCEDLLPPWLRFVRGVVDSPDLTLNVSREMLQQDRRMAAIRKRITKKVLDSLAKTLADDRPAYEGLWASYGRALKEGIASDPDDGLRIQKIALFHTTADAEHPTTLAEYVERMPEEQKVIWHVSGATRVAAENSPHIEAVRERGHEVLLLIDPIDEWLAPHLTTFEGKEIRSVTAGELDLDDSDGPAADAGADDAAEDGDAEGDAPAADSREAEYASLVEAMQLHLDDDIKEVRLSKRLKKSPVCLVGDAGGLSAHLERMLRDAGQEVPKAKRVLEINADHAVISGLLAIYTADRADSRIESWSKLLFGQALLAEGAPLPDPVDFTRRVADLMTP